MFDSNDIENDLTNSICDDHQHQIQTFLDSAIFNEYLDPTFSFFYLPSPFLSYEFDLKEDIDSLLKHDHDLLLQHQQKPALKATEMLDSYEDGANDFTMTNKSSHSDLENAPRKKSSKHDRHRKINTAKGPRDRRMRLSLKVAHEFFDLQDKLGFDKASKTLEWLLVQSEPEIKKLYAEVPKLNYNSNANVMFPSPIKSSNISNDKKASIPRCKKKERNTRPARKMVFDILARESRLKARERAKKRTREKMMLQRANGYLCSLKSHNMTNNTSMDPVACKIYTEGMNIDDSISNHLQNQQAGINALCKL